MSRRLSGKDIEVQIGKYKVMCSEATLAIEDSSAASPTNGRPNGYIRGSVKASGELTVDTINLNIIIEAARAAGSFMELDTFDINFNGETTTDKVNYEAFECLLSISDLLSASDNDDRLMHKIRYEVTGRDFVKINGVPYAPEGDKERLL